MLRMTMESLFNHYVSKLDLTMPQYEAVCALANSLFEDAASTAKHKTKRIIRNVLPKFNNVFDEIAKDDENNPILTEKGNTQTVIEYLEHNLRNTFFHDGKTSIKFEPGTARIAYGELGMQANEDTRKLTLLGKILQEISIAHEAEYDSNLNGMTFDELNERFGASIHKADAETQEQLKNKTYERSDYIIKWIPDFSTAQQYSQYTDYGPSEHWCLTHLESMWGSYTGSHNENKVYFCHVPNFESVPRETGPNAPLDTYGLSLISVIVTPENQLRAVTCRWNHTNGGSDAVMKEEQLSNLLGGYVFDLCPPYSREEVIQRGYIYLNEVQKMLDDGIDLSEYIDDYGRININGKMNILLQGRKLLSDKWFDWIDFGKNEFIKVELNGKFNFIDTEGHLLSAQWFDDLYNFVNGFAKVELNEKNNFIDTKGHLLSDQWFDSASSFDNGLAPIRLNGKCNFIDTKGNIRFKQWFDWVDYFKNGFAIVHLNDKRNFIDTEGNIISDQWFDSASSFDNGLAHVRVNKKHNFIDTEGNIISDQWFDWVGYFKNGFAYVKLNEKFNFIDTEGNIISDQWFDGVDDFNNRFAMVRLNGKFNFIDTEGNIISDQGFDGVGEFNNGFAHVRLNGKHNFIDTEGNIISGKWFDSVGEFKNGFAKVGLNGKVNFINTKGNIISDQWFDTVGEFKNGFAWVILHGKVNRIDTKGNISRQ